MWKHATQEKGRRLKEALHNLSLFYAKFVSKKKRKSVYVLNDAFGGNLNLIVSKSEGDGEA